jgi:hypothetical protein
MGGKSGFAVASAQAGQTVTVPGVYDLTAAEAEDDTLVIKLVKIPAQHKLVSLVVSNDDLDTGAALIVDVGILDEIQDPSDTTDADFFAASVNMQAAAVNAYQTAAMLDLGVVNYDRFVTATITTAAGTGAAGSIKALLTSRPTLGPAFGD